MKDVCFVTSHPDTPRVTRMARTLSKRGVGVTILEWDRSATLRREEWIDGVRTVRLRLKGSYGLLASITLPLWLLYVGVHLLRNGYDVVQAQNFDNLLLPLLLRPLKRFRIVYDLADFYADAYMPGHGLVVDAVRHAERRAIKSVDALIMVSEGQVSQVGEGNLPKRYEFVYNTPMDDELPRPSLAAKAGRSDGRLVLLYVGVLSRDRMPLLANLVNAVERVEDFTFRVAGKDEGGGSFFRRKFRSTVYLGKIPSAKVLAETLGCDCVVLPYDSRMTGYVIGLPNKLFEALALAKPVVTQKGTLADEIVRKGNCGFSTDYLDLAEIRQTLREICRERLELPGIGTNGRRLFEERFSWPLVEGRIVRVYDYVLKGEIRPPFSPARAA